MKMKESYYKLLNDIVLGYNRCTPTKVFSLRNNQIFVFGTNRFGSQKYGAAGLAAKSFGAKVGVTEGPTGMCYALPTLGFSEKELVEAVNRFEQYVRANLNYTFLVTPVGCGHAGFDVNIVANMFKGLLGLRNVMLPEDFLRVYRKECNDFFSANSPVEVETSIDNKIDETEKILQFFDESVHDVVKYLLVNSIPFNKDGGFSLQDEKGIIIAEAELGIEVDKVVIAPFDSQSAKAFEAAGYDIMSAIDYLNKKNSTK